MAHVRQQIRDAFVTAVTGLATTGANVYNSRPFALDDSQLPALSVYSQSEAVTEHMFDGTERRELQIALEIHARNNDTPQDSVDDICIEVEEAVVGDASLAALVKDVFLESVEMAVENKGKRPLGTATQTWLCIYYVDRTDVEAAA